MNSTLENLNTLPSIDEVTDTSKLADETIMESVSKDKNTKKILKSKDTAYEPRAWSLGGRVD
jgi:hypothetical protein